MVSKLLGLFLLGVRASLAADITPEALAAASCDRVAAVEATSADVLVPPSHPEEAADAEEQAMQLLQQGLTVVNTVVNTVVKTTGNKGEVFAASAVAKAAANLTEEASAAKANLTYEASAPKATANMTEETSAMQVGASVKLRRQEPEVVTTTPDPTGLTLNGAGDLEATLSVLILNVVLVVVFFYIFDVLRKRYPLMYINNVLTKQMPGKFHNGWGGWREAVFGLSVDVVSDHMGLDQAMLLEFTHLGMRIMMTIGVPLLFICGPLNLFFGGYAAGDDYLSYLSFGNVENGSDLYWFYGFVVWLVVIAVQRNIVHAQQAFMVRRFKWLREMAPMRANTILVEGIPEAYCSDEKLHAFFEEVMPGDDNVISAYLAKDTSLLLPKVRDLESAKQSHATAEAEWEAAGHDESKRPLARATSMPLNPKVDAIQLYEKRIEELQPEVERERDEVLRRAKSEIGGVNLNKGFVTFKGRVEAEIGLRLNAMSEDLSEWSVSSPPAPEDIQWNDLTQNPTAEKARHFFGYTCVVILYFLYMPATILVTNLANVIDLGPLQPLWEGYAPTMGLLVMVSFLPTFLILIFQIFFTLKAGMWAQHVLQIWYYWFQVVFVILIAAVGQDVIGFTTTLFTDPIQTFKVLADTMPYATHFFMNYQIAQYLSYSMGILRYVNLAKFIGFSKIWSEEEARAMSEPEDQDYYGMGGRSARITIALAVGIIYGTLSPPICLLTFLLMCLIRVCYGYALPFAETKKTDLGGVFWVSSLQHLFVANIIYCVLMTGVLFYRSKTYGPAAIAGPSILYVFYNLKRFNFEFNWVNLPLQQVIELESEQNKGSYKRPILGVYMQPELNLHVDDKVKGISGHVRNLGASAGAVGASAASDAKGALGGVGAAATGQLGSAASSLGALGKR